QGWAVRTSEEIIEYEQVLENIHGRHHAINELAQHHTNDATEIILTVRHSQRITANVCHTPRGMIRGEDIEPAIRGELRAPLAAFCCAQRTFGLRHANVSELRH